MCMCVYGGREDRYKCNKYDERIQGIVEEENSYSLENLESLARKGIELNLKEGVRYIL